MTRRKQFVAFIGAAYVAVVVAVIILGSVAHGPRPQATPTSPWRQDTLSGWRQWLAQTCGAAVQHQIAIDGAHTLMTHRQDGRVTVECRVVWRTTVQQISLHALTTDALLDARYPAALTAAVQARLVAATSWPVLRPIALGLSGSDRYGRMVVTGGSSSDFRHWYLDIR